MSKATPLKRARISSGMTQQSVADAADISVQYYQRLEAGQHVPGVDIANRIAAALGRIATDFWPVPSRRRRTRRTK